jgi:hypothetical protein
MAVKLEISLSMMEEHRVSVFDNRVLRRGIVRSSIVCSLRQILLE